MVDTLTKQARSWTMSRIRGRHTKPEIIIRSLLHRAGYRFRINNAKLPGRPDIVLAKYKTVIFVHGCFWHRHKNCSKASTPDTNREYWQQKFRNNVARDKKVRRSLKDLEWKVIVVWECEVMKDMFAVVDAILKQLGAAAARYPVDLDRSAMLKIAEKRSAYLLKKREV